MATRTPPIYATGIWRVDDPFVLEPDTIYVCKAVRSLEDIEARGIDPFTTFYEPHGLSRDAYDNDVLNMASIVTLMSSTAATLYIPDTYITSFPDTTTMPYSHVVLSVSLGAVPDTLALSDAKQKIEDIVLSSLGITANVREHVSGVLAEGMDVVTHQSLENQRLVRIENNQSSHAQLQQKNNENLALRQRIQALESVLIDQGIVS